MCVCVCEKTGISYSSVVIRERSVRSAIVYFKRLDSRQNELKMYVISIWSRFEVILCKTNTRRTWKIRQTG